MIDEHWHRGRTFPNSIFNGDHIIATVVEHGIFPHQRNEYAALIAAAPEMLAALKKAKEIFSEEDLVEWLDTIDALLDKAEWKVKPE